jgi:DNA-binding IclR family transcriptional regulator
MDSSTSLPPGAGADDAGGGVIAVRRALRVLEAFGVSDAQLTLAELSRRTGFHKTTVLRLARTLAADNYLVQKEDGSWRLGRAAGWLGAC